MKPSKKTETERTNTFNKTSKTSGHECEEPVNFLTQLFKLKRPSLIPKNLAQSKQYIQPKPRQQMAEEYSQVYLDSGQCFAARGDIKADKASEEVTKHFDNTLMEINSILSREEDMREAETAVQKETEYVHTKVKTLADELEKKRFQATSGKSGF